MLAVVYEALLLALHVCAWMLQAEFQHLLGVLQQLIRVLRLCTMHVDTASMLHNQAALGKILSISRSQGAHQPAESQLQSHMINSDRRPGDGGIRVGKAGVCLCP